MRRDETGAHLLLSPRITTEVFELHEKEKRVNLTSRRSKSTWLCPSRAGNLLSIVGRVNYGISLVDRKR